MVIITGALYVIRTQHTVGIELVSIGLAEETEALFGAIVRTQSKKKTYEKHLQRQLRKQSGHCVYEFLM